MTAFHEFIFRVSREQGSEERFDNAKNDFYETAKHIRCAFHIAHKRTKW